MPMNKCVVNWSIMIDLKCAASNKKKRVISILN